jgi:hypothetical protein
MTRPQATAIVAAALLAALLGLALLLVLLALHADQLIAQTVLSAAHGQMDIGNVMHVMTNGGQAAHHFLSK